jgi:uncharacterized protein (DUF342 family)
LNEEVEQVPEENEKPVVELSIETSPDMLSAKAIIRGGYDPHIDYDAIIKQLDKRGIIYGVDIKAIKNLVAGYKENQQRRYHEAVIALGLPPRPGIDGHVDFMIEEKPPVVIDETGRADFRNIQRYYTVDAGQVLAHVTPPTPGENGWNILGEEVAPPDPAKPQIKAGDNVKFLPDKNDFVAAIHGIFVREKETIAVSPVLGIPGNVGLSSGNVTYDGNVKIGGNIERGSMVSCLGDLEVGGMIESNQVRTGGSIKVRKGINARRDGIISAGGNIQSVYVENSDLTLDGSLIVEKSIVSCKIVCYGDILVTARSSTITGCEIQCFGSVACDTLGSSAETPMRIELGAHYRNHQYYELHARELEEVERDLEKKTEEINKIKIYVQRMRGKIPVDKQAAFRVRYNEYKAAIELRQRVQHQVLEFRESRYNSEEVRLIVRDTVHPGVVLVYRDHVEKITAAQTRAVFRFKPGMAMKIEAFRPADRAR